jgi:hypothetical protein
VARHDDGGWEPSEGIGNALGIGGPCPDAIASIVTLGRAKILAFDGMRGPSATSGGFFMDENFRSGRGKGSAIEVKRAVDMSLGG